MKRTALGLVALLAAALLPITASAASKKDDAGAAGDAKSHAQAMSEAPPLLQQLGLPCTPTDGNFMQGSQKNEQGKQEKVKIYELVCSEGLGFMIMAPEGGQALGFDCLALSQNKAKGGLYCKLPANADPAKSMQPLLTKAGLTCTPAQARYIGTSATPPLDEYEVQCSEGSSYVVQAPRAGSTAKLMAVDCLQAKENECQFLAKDKALAAIGAMAAPAGRTTTCPVGDYRYVGTTAANKNSYYEISCSNGQPGYILQVDGSNKYVGAMDCARAGGLGGCQLTAATQDVATYAKLVKQIGYPCAVKGYRSLGQDSASNREIVEISCSDHADGAFALLPVGGGQKGEYYNCARAELRKLQCTLTSADATNALLASQIKGLNETCAVSKYRALAVGSDRSDYVEVACKGEPGWVVQYAAGTPEKAQAVLSCASAKSLGGCKLQ